MPGMGQPEWWLYAWTVLKYLPDCSLKRSWPLRTSLKVSRVPLESSASASVEAVRAIGAPRKEPEMKQLESALPLPRFAVTVGATLEVFQPSVPSSRQKTSSLTGWL